eukprot:6414999-Pyramimonas_sp.AAC.1
MHTCCHGCATIASDFVHSLRQTRPHRSAGMSGCAHPRQTIRDLLGIDGGLRVGESRRSDRRNKEIEARKGWMGGN